MKLSQQHEQYLIFFLEISKHTFNIPSPTRQHCALWAPSLKAFLPSCWQKSSVIPYLSSFINRGSNSAIISFYFIGG